MSDSSSDPPAGDPPSSEPNRGEAASVESVASVERCPEARYTVQCTMPKDHDGTHQHVPPNEGVILSWNREPS